MKKLTILLIPLLITMTLLSMNFGCDEAEEIKDNIQDKVEDITGDSTPKSKTTDEGIPFTSDFWLKVNTGQWEETPEGLKVYGAGYRFGHQGVQSKVNYNFADSETFIKWKANGGANGEYSAFWVFLMSDYDPETAENSGRVRGGYFTTNHSYKNSVVINEDTWYYTRIKVNADSSYTAVTTTGDYDINGGTSIYTGTGTYQNAETGKIVVVFQDNYGGTETYLVVGEAKTSAGTAGEVIEPPSTPSAGEKTVTVWICEGVRNATINGGNPILAGQDNSVLIMIDHPMWAEFDYTDSYGREQHTRIDLDSYYDYFILREDGGWTQVKYRKDYENDKDTCPAPTSTPTPTPTSTTKPTETTFSCVLVTELIPGAHRSQGVFFTNTVTLDIPRNFVSVVMSQDCEGTRPIGIDDEARVTVTLPSGQQQSATINENGPYSLPIGEQWILSNAIDFDPGINEIKVELVNVYAPPGSNAASSIIYIVALPTEPSPVVTPVQTSTPKIDSKITTDLGHFPSAIAFDGTNIWVTTKGNSSLNKLSGTDGILLDTYSVRMSPSDVLYDGVNIWVANQGDDTVMKISPSNGAILGTYPVGDYPTAIEYYGENIWVANMKGGTITKLRASDGVPLLTYTIPGGNKLPVALAFDGTYLWVGCHWGYLMRFSVSDDTFQSSFQVGGHISGLVYDGSNVHAVAWYDGGFPTEVRTYSTSQRVWLSDQELENVNLPSAIAYDGNNLWVADNTGNTVIKLPASVGENQITYQAGDGPVDMIFDGANMWVANERDSTVIRIPVR